MNDPRLLGREVQKVANQIRRHMDALLKQFDITSVQGMILLYLHDHSALGDVFQKDLEKAFDLRSSTLTGVLHLMESRGLIYRVSAADDARLKKILLTAKAVHIQEHITAAIRQNEAAFREILSPEEIDLFFDMLQRISARVPSV